MDFLPQWASDLSGWGVVAVGVIMLMTGRGLATRREVDAEKARADTWQDAWKTERAAAASTNQAAHNEVMREHAKATSRALEAMQEHLRMTQQPSDESEAS